MRIKKKLFFCFLIILFVQIISSYNYGEGKYGDSYYSADSAAQESTNVAEVVTSSEPGYFPKTYYTDEKFQQGGDTFYLRTDDKIIFFVNSIDHVLTLKTFNFQTAKVKIESGPIDFILEKGVLYEFDLNNDSIKDIIVRYDGSSNRKATIFIQEIIYKNVEGNKNSDETFSTGNKLTGGVASNLGYKLGSNLLFSVLVFLAIALVLSFILYKLHRRKRYSLYGY